MDEVSATSIPRDSGATDLFPYGYVVSNVHTPGSRALPANPANSQWDGEVSFSFKLPLQSNPKLNPYSITMVFQVVDDANTRVTESVEEQNAPGDVAAGLRAATLGSVDLRGALNGRQEKGCHLGLARDRLREDEGQIRTGLGQQRQHTCGRAGTIRDLSSPDLHALHIQAHRIPP